jgi:hypothetical protein
MLLIADQRLHWNQGRSKLGGHTGIFRRKQQSSTSHPVVFLFHRIRFSWDHSINALIINDILPEAQEKKEPKKRNCFRSKSISYVVVYCSLMFMLLHPLQN